MHDSELEYAMFYVYRHHIVENFTKQLHFTFIANHKSLNVKFASQDLTGSRAASQTALQPLNFLHFEWPSFGSSISR